MFQLDEEQIDTIFDCIFTIFVIGAICFGVLAFSTLVSVELDPYSDACGQMKEHFAGLSRSDCIDYLNDNPGATGQDVLDHYNIITIEQIVENPVDDLLEKPIIPIN